VKQNFSLKFFECAADIRSVDSLNNLFQNPGNSADLEEILSTFDRELRELIAYDALSVLLVEDGQFNPVYAVGARLQDVAWFQTRAGEGVLARAVQERHPVLHPIRRNFGEIESALIYPIEHDLAIVRQVAGVLVLQRAGDNAFSNGDLHVLGDLAPKMASSIENARRYRTADELSEFVPVIGVAGVRSLFQRLDAELARARRGQETLAVLQCSIDGCDGTDRLCSPATRSAIEKVALKLRENCREYDFTARSGEDLVLVLPGFRPEYVDEKCQAVKKIVEETGSSAGLPLFASVGAAFYPADGTDAEDLLAVAAQKLNLARQSVPSGVQ
jgi:diguanylate cyclase (GGDEF)-like protein